MYCIITFIHLISRLDNDLEVSGRKGVGARELLARVAQEGKRVSI